MYVHTLAEDSPMSQLRAAAVDFVLRYEDGPSVGVSACTVSDRWKKLGGVNWTERWMLEEGERECGGRNDRVSRWGKES